MRAKSGKSASRLISSAAGRCAAPRPTVQNAMHRSGCIAEKPVIMSTMGGHADDNPKVCQVAGVQCVLLVLMRTITEREIPASP